MFPTHILQLNGHFQIQGHYEILAKFSLPRGVPFCILAGLKILKMATSGRIREKMWKKSQTTPKRLPVPDPYRALPLSNPIRFRGNWF